MSDFQPVGGQIRRSGTGCITEINDHLFEGRYSPVWPDGKRHAKNVYATTRQECEEKLRALIKEMQAERKLLLDQMRGITPPETLTKKQRQIWTYEISPQRDQLQYYRGGGRGEPAYGGQVV